MKKPLIIGSAIAIGLAIGGGVFFWQKAVISGNSTPEVVVTQPTPAPEEKIWKDASGFTFTYPADILVDQHDEDQDNYAHVELTHKDHPGSLVVWAKDLPVGVVDAASWVKKDKLLAAGVAAKASLGGEKAQLVVLQSPVRSVIGTVYDEVLWYIDVLPADVYWNGVLERVQTSFAFTPVTDAPSGSSSLEEAGNGAVDEAVDEEEVIE